jgi:hypothetical protein
MIVSKIHILRFFINVIHCQLLKKKKVLLLSYIHVTQFTVLCICYCVMFIKPERVTSIAMFYCLLFSYWRRIFVQIHYGSSWSWSYGSWRWIYNYLCNKCLSSLMLWVRISIRAGCTTLCDKVCQWLPTGRWFSPSPPVSSTNKTNRHDITEILFKVELNTIKQTNKQTNNNPNRLEALRSLESLTWLTWKLRFTHKFGSGPNKDHLSQVSEQKILMWIVLIKKSLKIPKG